MNLHTKKYIVVSILIGFLFAGTLSFGAQHTYPNFLKRSGSAISPVISTDELGSTSNRWDKIWTDDLDTTILTVGTVVSGNINMGGYAITNAGTITGTNFVATSTDTASTFVYRIGIATTTPAAELVVNDDTATSTIGVVSDASGFGGELIIQAPNGICYGITCNGLGASGCVWATSTCTK